LFFALPLKTKDTPKDQGWPLAGWAGSRMGRFGRADGQCGTPRPDDRAPSRAGKISST